MTRKVGPGMKIVEIAAATARLLVGGTLVFAGFAKLHSLQEFALVLMRFPISRTIVRDRAFARIAALAVCATEIALGAAFALGYLLVPTAVGTTVLLVAFTAGLTLAVVRGERLSCRCFGGATRNQISGRSILRNAVLLTATGVAITDPGLAVDEVVAGRLSIDEYLLGSAAAVQLVLLCVIAASLVQIRSLPTYLRRVPQFDRSSLGVVWQGAPERRL